jgi:hypothetical protein
VVQVPDPVRVEHQGGAVQLEPMKPMFKASGTKRLKLKYDELLATFAFTINLRCYTKDVLVLNLLLLAVLPVW